jgi:hypothetical protein
MDYEALKDQWSDVEDRDGIRLSWNTFPSTRMVRDSDLLWPSPHHPLILDIGSVPLSRSHRRRLHPIEGKARCPFATI